MEFMAIATKYFEKEPDSIAQPETDRWALVAVVKRLAGTTKGSRPVDVGSRRFDTAALICERTRTRPARKIGSRTEDPRAAVTDGKASSFLTDARHMLVGHAWAKTAG
jgi:hypothetical protein